MTNIIPTDNWIFYGLCTFTICVITGFCIKYYFHTTVIPNSPPTFNINQEQLKEVQKILDRWEELENVNEDVQSIIGEEVFDRMEQKFETLENKINEIFEDLEDNLWDTFRNAFENEINSPFEECDLLEIFLDLIEIFPDLTNLIFPFWLIALILILIWIKRKIS